MFCHRSDKMSQRSKVSKVALWRYSLNVIVFVFAFVFVVVFLLVRSCFFMTPISDSDDWRVTKVGLELLGQLKMEGLLHVRVRQFQFSQIFKHFQSELILRHFVRIKLKTSTEFSWSLLRLCFIPEVLCLLLETSTGNGMINWKTLIWFCDYSRWFCVKRQLPRSCNYDLESYVSFWIFLISFYFKVLARVYVAAKSGAPGWWSFWRILEDNCCQAESRWSWIRFARGLKIIKVLFLQWFQNWNYFLFSSTMSCPVHNITVFTVERRWLQVNRIAVTFKKIVLKGGRWHVHVFSVVFSFLLKIVWEFMCRDGALKSVSV